MQVNLSRGGVPKRPISLGKLGLSGFEGDAFQHPKIHGGLDQALLLITIETIEELRSLGYPVFPGALGENLTTSGLDRRMLRAGQQFHVGSARIELTKLRIPCRTLDRYNSTAAGIPIQKYIFEAKRKSGNPSAESWGRSGFYARVTQPGDVAPGDSIVLESQLV